MKERCCKKQYGVCDGGHPLADKTSRFALCTLLTLGDAYLPGVMCLGWSVREHITRRAWPNIDMCCMYTPDVSHEAMACMLTVYDKLIPVPYIRTDPSMISHRDQVTRGRYSALLTKLNVFGIKGYSKVLYLDSDMVVLRPELINLLALSTPAAVFYGCTKPFSDASNEYGKKVCPHASHGSRVPEWMLTVRCPRVQNHMAFETSILLVSPSQETLKMVHEKLRSLRTPFSSDTGVFNMLFATQTHMINAHFLGRWQRVNSESQTVTLDSYGYLYKPWDAVDADYYDIAFWRMKFLSYARRNNANTSHRQKQNKNAQLQRPCNHPAMRLALRACRMTEWDRNKLGTFPLLGWGGQGFVLRKSLKRALKFTTGVGSPPEWKALMIRLRDSAANDVRINKSTLVLPIVETVKVRFVDSLREVYVTYETPVLEEDAVNVQELKARPASWREEHAYPTNEEIKTEFRIIFAFLKGVGIVHGDLSKNNIFIVPKKRRSAHTTKVTKVSCVRIIDWDHAKEASKFRPFLPQGFAEANEDVNVITGL